MNKQLLIDDTYLNHSLYICKAIALLSVITAHTTIVLNSNTADLLKQRFSSIGVVVFMILSGYFYDGIHYGSFKKMTLRKLKYIGIPWLAFGIIAYIWGEAHGFSFPLLSLQAFIKFVMGYKTYLYYLPMLMLCYFVFYKPRMGLLIGAIVFNVISLVLTSFGVLNEIIPAIGLTHYLNFFNWCGFFSLGIMCREKDLIRRIINWFVDKSVIRICVILLYLAVTVLVSLYIEKDAAGYFSKTGFIMELFAMIVVLILSTYKIFRGKQALYVAMYSFTTYLIHTMIISAMMYVPYINNMLSIFLPIIVLVLGTVFLWLLHKASRKLKFEKIFEVITGTRKIKI